MVKLIAYQAFEGSGILEEDSKLVFIDFPYTKKNEIPITTAQVGHLINRMDFEASKLEFRDGKAAIAHLRKLANQSEDPFANETEPSIAEKFNALGTKNLNAIVDSIRSKYIENHQYGRAMRGLERIKNLPVVKEDGALHLKIVELLLACHQEIADAYAFKRQPMMASTTQNARQVAANMEAKFPTMNGSSYKNLLSLQAAFQKFV
jgi:hypothetical protein